MRILKERNCIMRDTFCTFILNKYQPSTMTGLGFSNGFNVSKIIVISSLTSTNKSSCLIKSLKVFPIKDIPFILIAPEGKPLKILKTLFYNVTL